MNKTFFLPLIIVFFTFYYFLFPRVGGSEIILMPEKAWSLFSSSPVDEDLLVSRGEQKALFYKNGRAPYLPDPRRNSVLTEDYYFFREDGGFILKDLENGNQYFIDAEGEALIQNSHIYVLDLWKGRIQEFDRQGNSLWKWQALGPITALDAGTGGTAIGLLDGSVQIFDDSGIKRIIESSENKRDCVIYGLALSPDGKRISVLSGLDEQRVREYDVETLTFTGEEHILESRFSRPVKMAYSPVGDVLWIEQTDKVIQLSPENEALDIPQEGRLLYLSAVESDGRLMILTEKSRRNSSSVFLMNQYSLEGSLISSMPFSVLPDDIIIKDGQVFLSMAGRILKMARRES